MGWAQVEKSKTKRSFEKLKVDGVKISLPEFEPRIENCNKN